MYNALSRQEVKNVIEGKGAASRVPVMLQFWTPAQNFGDRTEQVRELIGKFPQDVQTIHVSLPDIFEGAKSDPNYRWMNTDEPEGFNDLAIDERIALSDWEQLDAVLADFPDPEFADMYPNPPESDGRYRLGSFWFCFFERHWMLRGMTNALTDYYFFPDEVHKLFRALTDFYKRLIARGKIEANLDGIFTSDDIGTQTGPFFSREIFEEFFKPYYAELIQAAHENDMHFWLHTCGKIDAYIPDFCEIGLDVLHPIQKYTMEEADIAKRFGDKICLWAGFDVQQVIPWQTPEDVRNEVHFMMDTYFRKDGRFMFTAGNGLTPDCTLESMRALYEEAYGYGEIIANR